MSAEVTVVRDRVAPAIPVARPDLVAAWTVLEKRVVSLRKMGSYYATPGPDVPLSPEREQSMLRDLDAYFSPELVGEISKARRLLGEYLPDDEAEAISEALEYWRPRAK